MVHQLVDSLAAAVVGSASREALAGAARDVALLRTWCDSRELAIAHAMAAVSSFPEKDLADAQRRDLRDAARVVERLQTTALLSGFSEALADGWISGRHVDIVGHAVLDVARRTTVAKPASLVSNGRHG